MSAAPESPDGTAGPIGVEVAYATPREQLIIAVQLPAGSCAADAIELSAIRARFPEIPAEPEVGIFSRRIALTQTLQAGDRVEIYRPLIADPKEVRRRKALSDREARQKSS